MQTNFLWASHEHLIFVRRTAWIETSQTSEQFIWKNRRDEEEDGQDEESAITSEKL